MSRISSFYLITDNHYVSKKNWVEGGTFDSREQGDQIVLKLTPEILDTFADMILADSGTDTVIFTGDNVNNGDMNSHYEFRDVLKKLSDGGKNVYVITATHDYCGAGDDENGFSSCRYTLDGTEPIPFMRKAGLFDFYFDYGPKQALSVHRGSGSYVVRLGDGARLIMICDNGNGRSHCGLFEDGIKWLTEQIRAARADGDYVLLATHHPVLPPWEVYRHLADFELYGGYAELSRLMCSENVRVVFTGHTHVQSIRKYTDEEGRWFLDVATIAAVSAAGKMRHVTVDADSGVCEVRSVGLDRINSVDLGGRTPFEYLYPVNFIGRVEKYFPYIRSDFDTFLKETASVLSADKLRAHKRISRCALILAGKLKLSFAAKFGKVWKDLSADEKAAAKNEKLIDVLFIICRHIFAGNAPFSPDTVEYKSLHAAVCRIDKIVSRRKIEAVRKLIPPSSSLAEMADDFLYNCRTGDDDYALIDLK